MEGGGNRTAKRNEQDKKENGKGVELQNLAKYEIVLNGYLGS